MTQKVDKYIYYTITPREQLFKQLAGFLFFLRLSKLSNKILVLPRFEIKNKFYNYEDLFDFDKINNNFKVITFDNYVFKSQSNRDISKNTESYIHGTWQLPINSNDYMNYRKHIDFNKKYLTFKATEKYLAIHWRQEDFLKIRPHVVMTKEELVIYVNKKLKELNLKKVYIATNSNVEEHMKYIHDNLPTFLIPQNNMSDIDYAIYESIICQQSEYFIGSDTSLYSAYIIGEKMKNNKNNFEIFKK
tara:strand:+ start:63 stop:800 length:738 start_codon:yes stop_codon:yes gene_type:complete